MHSEPVVFPSNIIAKKKRGAIIDGNQHIHGTIVVEVAQSQATPGIRLGKNRAALPAHVDECVSFIVKEQKRFAILEGIINFLDEVVRGAISNNQIKFAIIVIVEELQSPSAHRTGRSGDA